MFKDVVDYIRGLFATPSAEVLALRELEEAKRKLLEAQTGREYANSMCQYHQARIYRLTGYLHKATNTTDDDDGYDGL